MKARRKVPTKHKRKIDKAKLRQLARQGKSQAEIARYFNVSEAAISKAVKRLKMTITQVATLEHAHEIVEADLNSIEQLNLINKKALRIISDLEDSKDNADRAMVLKGCREVRNQLSLQLEIFKTLYDLEAVREFQKQVLDAIAEVDKPTREKIIENLKQRRALRGSVRFDS